MPAPPVFSERTGEEGALEVFHQMDTKHLGKAGYDIHIAGEIRIDLDGHIDTAEEKRHAAAVGRAENGVHGGLHPVGDHAFFEKTPEDTLESKGEIFI